jgi:hypothetical protein
MRITDKKAIEVKSCANRKGCEGCTLMDGLQCKADFVDNLDVLGGLATDLLEARSVIREMRDQANLIHEVIINPVLQSLKAGRKESQESCKVISGKILDISKEYAK